MKHAAWALVLAALCVRPAKGAEVDLQTVVDSVVAAVGAVNSFQADADIYTYS